MLHRYSCGWSKSRFHTFQSHCHRHRHRHRHRPHWTRMKDFQVIYWDFSRVSTDTGPRTRIYSLLAIRAGPILPTWWSLLLTWITFHQYWNTNKEKKQQFNILFNFMNISLFLFVSCDLKPRCCRILKPHNEMTAVRFNHIHISNRKTQLKFSNSQERKP